VVESVQGDHSSIAHSFRGRVGMSEAHLTDSIGEGGGERSGLASHDIRGARQSVEWI
jgi:hypothetical protein